VLAAKGQNGTAMDHDFDVARATKSRHIDELLRQSQLSQHQVGKGKPILYERIILVGSESSLRKFAGAYGGGPFQGQVAGKGK
jgi:hypothetical protein